MKTITHATAKYVLNEMFKTGKDAKVIIEEQNLWELTLEETEKVVDEVLNISSTNSDAISGGKNELSR